MCPSLAPRMPPEAKGVRGVQHHQDPPMEDPAKGALGATKKLWQELNRMQQAAVNQVGTDADAAAAAAAAPWLELKALASKANKAVQAMQRLARDEAVRADVRHGILREAVRDELIDREANAARVLDRQRTLAEAQRDGATVLERSLTSARGVEAAIGSLCPHQVHVAPGVALLANGR